MSELTSVRDAPGAGRVWLAAAAELLPLLFVPPIFLAAGVGWLLVRRQRVAVGYFAARAAALLASFAVILFFIIDEAHRDAERAIVPVAQGVFYAALIGAPVVSAAALLAVELRERRAR